MSVCNSAFLHSVRIKFHFCLAAASINAFDAVSAFETFTVSFPFKGVYSSISYLCIIFALSVVFFFCVSICALQLRDTFK